MRDLLELIDEALQQRRWSARQASIEAVGSAHLISRMRRGQEPPVSRLRALCEVFGLEFYVGPRRSLGGVDLNVGRLVLALEAVTAGFPDGVGCTIPKVGSEYSRVPLEGACAPESGGFRA